MIDLKTALSLTVFTVLVSFNWANAHPWMPRPLPPPSVRLTVHPPVSGAMLRGNFINPGPIPWAGPGIVEPPGGFVVTDQDYYSIGGSVGGPIIAFPNDVGPGFVKYDKPDIDFIAVGPPGPGPNVY